MMSYKWIITGLIITLAVTSGTNGYEHIFAMTTWVGEEVDLHCEDINPDSVRRFWNKGDELLTAGQDLITYDDRISLVNGSGTLRIVNVTLKDNGEYKCSVYRKPRYTRTIQLDVKEVTCENPENPLNGFYRTVFGQPVRHYDTISTGYTVRYHCDKGYELVGQATRTCTGTLRGWSSEEPYCQLEYIGRVMRKLDSIEDRLTANEEKITALHNNTEDVRDIISRLANVESRLSFLEINTSSVLTVDPSVNKPKEHLIDCSKEDLTSTDAEPTCMAMQSSVREGRSVSEFRWVLKNVNSMSPKEEHSPPFYQSVPGYKFGLKLVLYNDRSYNVYLMLLQSEFDDQLDWPFTPKSDVVLVMNVGDKEIVIYRYESSKMMTLKRPSPSTERHLVSGMSKGMDTLDFKFFFYK